MTKIMQLFLSFLVLWSTQKDAEAKNKYTMLTSCVDRPLVYTTVGPICGIYCPSDPSKIDVCGEQTDAVQSRKYKAFVGIPFAEPPIGELRFKPPVLGASWINYSNGNWIPSYLDGRQMPPRCPQFELGDMMSENPTVIGQEDCLFLNVYVPENPTNTPDAGLPVMVYIFGGWFAVGTTNMYYADKLMTRDVILVTISYRIGFLGFLSTDDEVAPGNLGLLDQEVALKWIQGNIATFGGDPSKVTLFGQSAGATSVHLQILNPNAEGLFSRAIMQSGTALMYPPIDHHEVFLSVASKLDCNHGSSAELLKCLQAKPASSLVHVTKEFWQYGDAPSPFGLRYNGTTLPGFPAQLLKDGKYNKVDIMMGINQHEGGGFTNKFLPQFNCIVSKFSDIGHIIFNMDKSESIIAMQILQHYLGKTKKQNYEELSGSIAELFGDLFYNMYYDYSVELHSKNSDFGKHVYAYELKHNGDNGPYDASGQISYDKDYVSHSEDLNYLFKFDSDVSKDTNNAENKKLERIMLDLWTNFATYGNPTPPGSSLGFTWTPVSPESADHLVLKPEPYMEPDQRCMSRKYFTTFNTRVNQVLYPYRVNAFKPNWKPWTTPDKLFKNC